MAIKWMPIRYGGDAQRGAVATEFMVVLPLFLIFVMGVWTVGSAYFQQLGFTEAAREGARYGATLQTSHPSGEPDLDWLQQVAAVATATAGRWEEVCVSYTGRWARRPPPGNGTYTYRHTNGEPMPTAPSSDPCWDDGRQDQGDEGRVQVVVAGRATIGAFLFQAEIPLDGASLTPHQNPHTSGSS